jgi:hypothetical protein
MRSEVIMAKQQKIRLRKDVTTVNGLTFKAGDELFVHSVTVRDSPQSTRGICGLGYELFELVGEQEINSGLSSGTLLDLPDL